MMKRNMSYSFCCIVMLTIVVSCLMVQAGNAQNSKKKINQTIKVHKKKPVIKRNGKDYLEHSERYNFEIILSHTKVKELFTAACENWTEQDPYTCGDSDYKLAGLCFAPICDLYDDRAYTTNGFRVAVVLFKSCENDEPDNVILKGYEGNIEGIFYDKCAACRDLKAVKKLKLQDSSFKKTPVNQFDLALFENSREFDFVFLSYEDYYDLAVNADYYEGGKRYGNGIIIRRAFSDLSDRADPNNQNSTDENLQYFTYRNLWFSPYPQPPLSNLAIWKSALKYRQTPHCPPYWRDNDLVATLREIVCEKMTKRAADDDDDDDDNIAIHFYSGYNFSANNWILTGNGLLLEFGLEYNLKFLDKRFAVEGLIGRYYATPTTVVYGSSVMVKSYFRLPKKIRWWVSVGPGLFDLSAGGVESGFTANAGANFRISDRFFLNAGLQWQHPALLTDRVASNNYWAVKAGVQYVFKKPSQQYPKPSDGR